MAKKDLSKISEIKSNLKGEIVEPENKKGDKFSDKEFYRDLDKIKNKSCCSIPVLFIFLIAVFALLVTALILLKNYTKRGIDYVAKNQKEAESDMIDSFITDTQNMNPGETLTLDFTEVEVANYLAISDPDFPLQKARLEIEDRGIIISGSIKKSILSLPVKAVVVPKVEEGRVKLYIDDLSSGSISLPQAVKNSLNDYLDLMMRSKNLYDDTLEITGTETRENLFKIDVYKRTI